MNKPKSKYDLNSLVGTYNIDNLYEQYKRIEFLKKLENYLSFRESSVVEFGSATGQMTELLAGNFKKILAVDGSSDFIEIAKNRVGKFSGVEFEESYFEDFSWHEKFDCLIMHHILEHIENPAEVLLKAKDLLQKDSVLAISVPNATALSRRLAVKMGILDSVYELTDNDKHHGHYRVYDWPALESQLVECGYRIIGRHGLSFKLLSDSQNIKMLDENIIGKEQIKGLWELADELPEHAGAIMIVAKTAG